MASLTNIPVAVAAVLTVIALIALVIISWSVLLVAIAAYFTPMLPMWAWVVILVLSCVITSLMKYMVKVI